MAEKKKRRPARRAKTRSLTELFRGNSRKKRNEFRPDPTTSTWLKTRKLTRQQKLRLLKWVLYALIVMMCLVIQDVIMSQFRLFGATTAAGGETEATQPAETTEPEGGFG